MLFTPASASNSLGFNAKTADKEDSYYIYSFLLAIDN